MNKQEWLKAIKRREEYGYPVNRKYCIQLKDCAVLRKLIKSGKVRKERTGYKSCRYTRLYVNEN